MKVALAGIVVLLAFATGASARTDALHLVRVARFDAKSFTKRRCFADEGIARVPFDRYSTTCVSPLRSV
jgi:hypothetical protein